MKIMGRMFVVFTFVSFCLFAEAANLYSTFKDYSEIRVFVKDVVNDSGDKDVKTDEFRETFKNVLKKRINIKFAYVKNRENADVIVNVVIKKFTFKEKVKPRFYSAYALVADVTAPKSLVRLTADYKVINPLSDKQILSYKNFTTEDRIPREGVNKNKAYVEIAHKNINRFIFRAFYKQRKSRPI